MGQNLRYLFGVGYPPKVVYFKRLELQQLPTATCIELGRGLVLRGDRSLSALLADDVRRERPGQRVRGVRVGEVERTCVVS